MCGISGFYNNNISNSQAIDDINSMLDKIVHRGPDSFGIEQDQGIVLGHRRLSIHDLSIFGHQPMFSHSGRYIISFNGEIYNFKELKGKYPNKKWQGHSDTEVLLEVIDELGFENALEKLNGMFAIALWDRETETLKLARDRFGEKPLYYYANSGVFYFSSELSSLETVPSLNLSLDRSSIVYQMERSYIPDPLSIYKEVKKLPPGHMLSFSHKNGFYTKPYWSLNDVIATQSNNKYLDEGEAIDALEMGLLEAVKLRMASDVPLGSFLSGGIDSSLVTALMQAQSSSPVNTFSIGFDVEGYNEAIYAKQVANILGTNHTEQYFQPSDALEIIPRLGHMFDEPFSDSSQLPTYLVSALARKKVTVCLSGDGGDELFAGYSRYKLTQDMWNKIKIFPCRRLFARVISNTPSHILNKLFFFLKPFAKKHGRSGPIGPKLKTFTKWLQAQDVNELYMLSFGHWKNGTELVKHSQHSELWQPELTTITDLIEQMMYQDSIAYLPGDILTKVDRTSMAVSLEGRMPLLDHNLAELAWRMPLSMKQRNGCGKWVLKEVLYKYLPKTLMDRPKKGFGVPINHWLKTDLREWAQDLLAVDTLSREGIFDVDLVQTKLKSHLAGEENNAAILWNVLMFQSWLNAEPDRGSRIG